MAEDGDVVIASRTVAGEILCSPRRCSEFAYLISIGGPGENVTAGFRNVTKRLRLVFEDAVTEDEGGPSPAQIERLVRFARGVDLTRGRLLVHCQAGISRSSAAAIIVLSVLGGPGQERAAVEHVRRIHPGARPNGRMLMLADELLQTSGGLVRAWENP